jgi:hypothetical protein
VHPSDATLLALIHGEPDGPSTERERAHLAQCSVCAAREAALRSSEQEIGALLGMLDHPVPRRPAPAARIRPRLARPALAASLALLLAGAAAAAVPGTALNRWVRRQLGGASGGAAGPVVAPVPTPAPAPAQAGGVELPGAGVLTVAFAAAEPGGVLTVSAGPRSGAALHALGGDVAYQVAKGRIGVDNRRPAGRYTLEVPAELERLTVLVAGRSVFDSDRHPLGPTPDTISLSPEPAR